MTSPPSPFRLGGAGLYVGLECDESAVMLCLANAAQDKVEYCRNPPGIQIEDTVDDNPCKFV